MKSWYAKKKMSIFFYAEIISIINTQFIDEREPQKLTSLQVVNNARKSNRLVNNNTQSQLNGLLTKWKQQYCIRCNSVAVGYSGKAVVETESAQISSQLLPIILKKREMKKTHKKTRRTRPKRKIVISFVSNVIHHIYDGHSH